MGRTRRNLSWLLRTAVAVFGLLACATTGTASCGDYLHIMPAADDRGSDAGAPPAHLPAPCSCEHGSCEPPVPQSPNGGPNSSKAEPSSDVFLDAEPDGALSQSHPFAPERTLLPNHRPVGIFHPPRR